MTPPASTQQVDTFAQACRRVGEAGLVRYSSGNLSWRIDSDLMLVSGSRMWLGRMRPEEVTQVRISDAEQVGSIAPSVESRFHAGIYRERPDVHVVLHCQSPCATAICCSAPEEFDFNVIIEVPFYIGEPAVVEYFPPGTLELAKATIAAAKEHDLILLRNHGQVVLGKDFDDVIQKAGFFELACEILLIGKDIQPLRPHAVADLRERARRAKNV